MGQGNSAVWAGTFTSTLEIFNNTIAYNMWDPTYSERNSAVVIGYPEEMEAPPVTLILVNNLFAFNADPLDGGSTGITLGPGVTLVREQNNLYWSQEDRHSSGAEIAGCVVFPADRM